MLIFIILFCIICPFLAIPFVIFGVAKDKKHSVIYSLLLALPLSLIAYNIIPDVSKDLYRYYVEMNYTYKYMSVFEYINVIFSNTKILFNTIQFIITKIGNYNLLPFFITLIGYSISFYIIFDYSNLKKIKFRYTLIILISFVCIFYHINFISGLAQYLAISISFLAFYQEYIKGKNKLIYKLLYILPSLIHISMIATIIFRILLKFDFKKIKKIYIVALCFYSILPLIAGNILANLSNGSLFMQKIYIYIFSGTRRLNSIFEFCILALCIIFLIIFYSNKKKICEKINSKYIDFMEFVILFNIFSVVYSDIFIRFFNLTLLMFIIFFLEYFYNSGKNEKIKLFFILLVFAIAIGNVNLNNFLNTEYKNDLSKYYNNIFYFVE